MTRIKGIISISANAEPQIAAPWDGRDLVYTVAELLLPETWTANDGGLYVYDGMSTKVIGDGTNNGLYILSGTDYTDIGNWTKVGGGAMTGEQILAAIGNNNITEQYLSDDIATTTQLATAKSEAISESQGYTNTKISDLVNASPTTLDTLKELADALGNDANFATTVTNAIGAKQTSLVSGENIKTINNESILGSGNIVISSEVSLIDIFIFGGE